MISNQLRKILTGEAVLDLERDRILASRDISKYPSWIAATQAGGDWHSSVEEGEAHGGSFGVLPPLPHIPPTPEEMEKFPHLF